MDFKGHGLLNNCFILFFVAGARNRRYLPLDYSLVHHS